MFAPLSALAPLISAKRSDSVRSKPGASAPVPARLGWFVAGLLLAVCLSACSRKDCSGVEIDGVCQALCVDRACGDGQVCVDNQCSPSCKAQDDCERGQCVSTLSDYGQRGRFCVSEGPAPAESEEQPERPSLSEAPECESNAECAAQGVQKNCVQGHCVAACLVHEHCAGVGSCSAEGIDSDGQSVAYCAADDFERALGQYGRRCVNGNADCDAVAGFRCLSRGEGDIDGYCSKLGCEDDAECPSGFYCNRDQAANFVPCTAACGLAGDATDPACILESEIGEGAPFRCGELGLELRSCRKRDYCAECESDADCRGVPGQICAPDPSGQKICTLVCDPNASGCPWGNASACTFNPELGVATCSHRSGSCRGAGNSCDPCADDGDCGAGYCSRSSFTGERFCVNLSDRCACPAGAEFCFGGGCPLSPGGLAMTCVPEVMNGPPAACFGAATIAGDETSQLGCWPPL